jgi:molecular chaperone Hsp33
VEPLDIRGRAVQLGPVLDSILHRHNYPEVVSALLAEAITLTILLGTSLKFEGKFIVQTQTDGPVSMLVVDLRTPGSLRAYARFDAELVQEAITNGKTDPVSLMGNGILAMTIDQGAYTQRYQGIVQLKESGLEEVAHQYFKQSEQIPTEVRMAVAQSLIRGDDGVAFHRWQAGGVLVQFLPESTDRMRLKDLPGGDGPEPDLQFEHDDQNEDAAWVEVKSLMTTVDDMELVDRDVTSERLLYRLFNEHGVRVYDAQAVLDDCSCSKSNVKSILANFSAEEIIESTVNDNIEVNCEFCSKRYQFDAKEFLGNN